MKTAIFTFFFFLFINTLPAQIDCNKFLEQGKKAAKQENFELCMNSFNSALRCGDKQMGSRRISGPSEGVTGSHPLTNSGGSPRRSEG